MAGNDTSNRDLMLGRLMGKLEGIETTLNGALEEIDKKLEGGEARFAKIEKRIYIITGIIVIILSALGYGVPEIAQMFLGGTPPIPAEAVPALPALPPAP